MKTINQLKELSSKFLDSNNKVVATVTTDANGKASVQNLTVGKYKI